MPGSVSAGRKQLSSKHVVQPPAGRTAVAGNLNRTTYLSRHRNHFVQTLLRP